MRRHVTNIAAASRMHRSICTYKPGGALNELLLYMRVMVLASRLIGSNYNIPTKPISFGSFPN